MAWFKKERKPRTSERVRLEIPADAWEKCDECGHVDIRERFVRALNVCPNCGGGFCPRPIRPAKNWKGDNYLGAYPVSTKIKHRPVDLLLHQRFSKRIKSIPPEMR